MVPYMVKEIQKDIALVFDCGATNVRVIAMDTKGDILASKSFSNQASTDPNLKGGLLWDVHEIWGKFCKASQDVISRINPRRICGISVTTFGVDGTLVDEDGSLQCPVISWQCERTLDIFSRIEYYISLTELSEITGLYPYTINTIFKLIWLKENHPELMNKGFRYIFISSIFIHKLCGALKNDITMAGTSMLLDKTSLQAAKPIFDAIQLDSKILGELARPGELAGYLHEKSAKETAIPQGTPVYFGGHDTQFAIFGSGAEQNDLVLSSGTWEILMARCTQQIGEGFLPENKLSIEQDVAKGLVNVGENWIASGIIEWFAKHFYTDLNGDALHEKMIHDVEKLVPQINPLRLNPDSYTERILSLNSTREEIYRALLESLSYKLRSSIELLNLTGFFDAKRIICVGGGSKNALWNQIRADVCNLPVQVISQKETTALGAALFVFAGVGLFNSPEEARKQIDYKRKVFEPSENTDIYNMLYSKYQRMLTR